MSNAVAVDAPPRMYRLAEVAQRTGLGRSTVYQLMQAGTFPRSVPLWPGSRFRAWVGAEVDEWIANNIRQSRSAPSA